MQAQRGRLGGLAIWLLPPQLDCSSKFPLTVLVFPWQLLARETSEPEALSEKKLETLFSSLFLATASRELTASLWEGAVGRSDGLAELHSKPTEVFRISTLHDPTLGWAVILHPREGCPRARGWHRETSERHCGLQRFFPCTRKAQKIERQMAGEQV